MYNNTYLSFQPIFQEERIEYAQKLYVYQGGDRTSRIGFDP